MDRSTKVSISKDVNTVRVVMYGQTVHVMLETGKKIKFMGKASMSGSMAAVTKETGRATTWTVTVYIHGKMAENTKASI